MFIFILIILNDYSSKQQMNIFVGSKKLHIFFSKLPIEDPVYLGIIIIYFY